MSTLLADDPPHPNATYSGLMLVEELLRLKRVAENKRLAQEAVAKHRGRPDSVPHVETDVSGNPSESFNWSHYRAVCEARRQLL